MKLVIDIEILALIIIGAFCIGAIFSPILLLIDHIKGKNGKDK